jgi:group I intron endonuclease
LDFSFNKVPGVYLIENTVNGKVYVGSSKDIKKRWKDHKWFLSHNASPNKYLQSAWNKYGESAFVFTVLEVVKDISGLLDVEQKWIDVFRSADRQFGYNQAPVAGSNIGYKYNEEFSLKCSERNRRSWKDPESRVRRLEGLKNSITQERLKKIGERSKAMWKDPDYREKWIAKRASPESRLKASQSMKDRWEDPEYRNRAEARLRLPEYRASVAKKTAEVWKRPEHKERISKANSKYLYEFTSPSGEKYICHSLSLFCKQNGLGRSNLRLVLKGKRKHHKGWTVKIIGAYNNDRTVMSSKG